tara:strand:- start:263 stop:448 length:186 start_codon:yes stop_codon:yes gene_type:complete
MFKYYFDEDLKKLGFKKYKVCKILKCTMPTLASRLKNPGTFTVSEINKLQEIGFEAMKRLI